MKNTLLLSLFMSINLSVNAAYNVDFQKMSNDAELIDMESPEWSCVLENNKSLVWEVKSESEGIQYALNTYTWFDGVSGRENGSFSKNCYWGKNCNTQSYIEDINKAELCTYSDWRLPTKDELNSIKYYWGDSDILIDSNFFPNTQMGTYWTSESKILLAWEIPFFIGGSEVRDKTTGTFVRLVRSAD
jgi:hypothetical protein